MLKLSQTFHDPLLQPAAAPRVPHPEPSTGLSLRGWLRRLHWLSLATLLVALLLLIQHSSRGLVAADLVVSLALFLISDALLRWTDIRAEDLAPLIAIVGCDGSGKSTLSTDLQRTLSATGPTELCYLGLGSGELANRIRRWPVLGPPVERALVRKATQTRSRGKKIPGLATALVVFGFSLLRLRRFCRVLRLRQQGVTVITDRYPQTEFAGLYDGPGLSAARPSSRAVAWLAARERRIYGWMAGFRPDLVFRLNVDLPTALARKPDHRPELLQAKVEVTPLLRFNGATIVDIDASADYEAVRDRVLERLRPVLAGRGRPEGAASGAGTTPA
ncbi:nucleoside/nucleotide kinase family protein [Roseomonas elaeocarpi]|uniref:Nucleoside triphosphate hydrolase n=1 Tax=Roseomonas elaeocarpi TaxID=907779 RepID=A0ABV6JW77_9PROT